MSDAVLTTSADVAIKGVSKSYDTTVALEDVSLYVARGEIVTLLGPSGCGKSTLLRIVAGFVRPDAGEVFIGGASVLDTPPHRSAAGLVFQSYALFPHLSVAENVAFGLKVRRRPKPDIKRTVAEMLERVGLGSLGNRRPNQLSGGQQQRVALARVLAIAPRVLLMDEPFGALDKKLRAEMQVEITRLVRDMEVTTIFVTHDQEEALVLSDRIAVMNRGQVIQVGPGLEIYRHPRTHFVADFLGNANLLGGLVTGRATDGHVAVKTDLGIELAVPARPDIATGQRVEVLVRPENVLLDQPNPNAAVAGVVVLGVHYGSHSDYQVAVGGDAVKVRSTAALFERGQHVSVSVRPGSESRLYVDGVSASGK